VMYVYGTPHITLPPIGELHKFNVIDDAQMSDDGVWLKAQYQDRTIYYRAEDLGELTHEEWEQAQELHKNQTPDGTDYNAPLDQGDWSGDTLPDWVKDDPANTDSESQFTDSQIEGGSHGEGTGQGFWIESGTGGNGNSNSTVESPEPEYPPTSGNSNGSTDSLPDWVKDDPANKESIAGESTDNGIEGGSHGEGTGQGFWIN